MTRFQHRCASELACWAVSTLGAPRDDFLITLLYAIKRGIQFVYQVEEQEVAAELIGKDENRRLLFWEAAEGGTGVWERLIEEPRAFAGLAQQALRVCHFDPNTAEEEAGHDPRRCAVACYECLLSYANQLEHHHLDRRLIREFLLRLGRGVASQVTTGRSREEQHRWLCSMTDPGSNLGVPFLDFLHHGGYRLPDLAQNRPAEGIAAQPDFYYEREGVPGVCVFVDGSEHDDPRRKERDAEARSTLENQGFRVITIRADQPLEPQVEAHSDVFGHPTSS